MTRSSSWPTKICTWAPDVTGFSPLLAARGVRQRGIGFIRNAATALRGLPLLRQVALDSGYPEQALWVLWHEAELKCALGSSDGTRALAHTGHAAGGAPRGRQ